MDTSGAVAQVADEAIASQELMITRIENTMAGMEEGSYKDDPRYQQMEYLKQAVQGKFWMKLYKSYLKHFLTKKERLLLVFTFSK